METTELIEIINKYGFLFIIGYLVIVKILAPLFDGFKMRDNINNKVYEKVMLPREQPRKSEVPETLIHNNLTSLKEHIFFQDVLYMMRDGVDKIDFGGPVRDQLFSDMVIAKLDEFYKRLNALCNSAIVDVKDWHETLTQLQTDAVIAYEYKWVQMGVPQIARERFSQWHDPRVEYVSEQIDKIKNSNVFNDVHAKTKAVLDLYTHILGATLIDIYGSAYDLNGELTGLSYKCRIIEPLTKKHQREE